MVGAVADAALAEDLIDDVPTSGENPTHDQATDGQADDYGRADDPAETSSAPTASAA